MFTTITDWLKTKNGKIIVSVSFVLILLAMAFFSEFCLEGSNSRVEIIKVKVPESQKKNYLSDEFILRVDEENQKLKEEIEFLEKENKGLRRQLADYLERIQRMEPPEAKTSTLERNRNSAYAKPSGPVVSRKTVLTKGKSVPFVILYDDPDWKRPTFHQSWYSTYFRFAGIQDKIELAYHRLFEVPPAGSATYDLFGLLGYEEKRSGEDIARMKEFQPWDDYQFLVFQADVKEIKYLGHQIAVIAEPRRWGAQRFSLKRQKVLPAGKKQANLLVQLVTPDGYEIDYEIVGNGN